ncbi:hypothetical protein ACWESJ_12405 [Staphylococcus xylosus]|uniref:Uncharacterized protein n=1 Tax=Staphylococcus gallinarum TaxID=1293 RepID=A0A418HKR4_STAGA|nr:hypothetical protein [Staphylococcus gallinarum]PUZ34335.1 hypothetical protein BUY27_08310 [Staphylococcus cohnii]RIL40833.1 hypothetical protein BUZ01_14040 [Staphylococcus gallinarum]RIO92915.1 hypothetical protein BUZ04_06005 [Staphylococcus gallinarum]
MIIAKNKNLDDGITLDFSYLIENKMTFNQFCELISENSNYDFIEYVALIRTIKKYDRERLDNLIDSEFSDMKTEEVQLLKTYTKLYFFKDFDIWYSKKEIVYILQGYEFIGFNGLDEIIDNPIKENSIKNLSLKLPDEYKGRKKTGKTGNSELYLNRDGIDELMYSIKAYNKKETLLNNPSKRHIILSDSDEKIAEYINDFNFDNPSEIITYIINNRNNMIYSLKKSNSIYDALVLLKLHYKEAKDDAEKIYKCSNMKSSEKFMALEKLGLNCVNYAFNQSDKNFITKAFLLNVHKLIQKYKLAEPSRISEYKKLISSQKNELLATFDYTKQEVKNSLKEIENINDEYKGVFEIDTIAEWVYRKKTAFARKIIKDDSEKMFEYMNELLFTTYDDSFNRLIFKIKE